MIPETPARQPLGKDEHAHILPKWAIEHLRHAAKSHNPVAIDAAITRVQAFEPQYFLKENYLED